MYFGLAKLVFESTIDRTVDRKEMASLAEKLRARFKVAVRVDESGFDRGSPTLVLTLLHSSKEKLSQTMDSIAAACETDGFGRLADEQALIEHVDYFLEEE